MADIMEFVEDIGDGAKKVFKNKKFWIVAAVVGGVALAMGYLKYRDEDSGSTAEDITAYEAIGYAGYPVVGGGGGGAEGDYSYIDETYNAYYDTLTEITSEYDSALLEMQQTHENDLDVLNSNIDDLSEKLITSQELMEQQQKEYQKQADLSQMKANSELYNQVNSAAQREALHAENKAIAEKYGWNFNSETGNWYDGENPVYLAAWQQAQALESSQSNTVATKKKAAEATVTFENNVDYQQKIIDAINNGSDASVINQLNAQRNAKIKATGVTNANSYYDKDVDYQALINKAKTIKNIDQGVINSLNEQRNAKIAGEK